MGQTLHFAIVGTGSIAGHFIRSIQEIDGCEVAALCSSTQQRALAAREKYNIEAYSDLSVLLQHEQVDIVCICTASGLHLQAAVIAANAGKHIICEKPLEIDTQRVDQMIQACDDNQVKLGCIFQNRFSEDFVKLRQMVESGLLGKMVAINAMIPWYRSDSYYGDSHWRGTLDGDGGGALINQGIHTVDLFQLLGGPVAEVFGKVLTTTHDIEGEDLAMAVVTFKSGLIGQIQASTSMWPGYPERLEVYGEKGSIILEGGIISHFNVQGIEHQVAVSSGDISGSSNPMAISHQLHRKQILDFANAVRTDTQPVIDGREGRKAVALIEGIYRSSRLGQPVIMG
ncbi:MAG: Gfo/Idh/MocA family oxidoreductase [Saprospiraceae bacterium]|nr:Gfo/Idh/MocA family oxidoreductase [Saprospiraceae bacterium]